MESQPNSANLPEATQSTRSDITSNLKIRVYWLEANFEWQSLANLQFVLWSWDRFWFLCHGIFLFLVVFVFPIKNWTHLLIATCTYSAELIAWQWLGSMFPDSELGHMHWVKIVLMPVGFESVCA